MVVRRFKNARRKKAWNVQLHQRVQCAPATPSSPSSETSAGKRKRGRALNLQSRLDSLVALQRKLQAKKTSNDNIFDEVEEIQEGLQANRDRITATTQAEEDDEITRPPRPYKRKSPIVLYGKP